MEKILKSLWGLNFSNIEYDYFYPNLYKINRCAFEKVANDFLISRDNGYHYCVFHIVIEGSGLLIVDGKQYVLKKNDLFILEPKMSHVYTSNNTDPLSMIWTEFDGANSAELMTFLASKGIRTLNIGDDNIVLKNMICILKYIQANNKKADPFKVSALMYNLICSIVSFAHNNEKIKEIYPLWLENAIDYIGKNYDKHITVKDVAIFVGYSSEHFSRLFSEYMKVSAWQYITMLRIEQSINLLKDDKNTIGYIAETLSFSDSTHFVKCFKNLMGITPNKYRKYIN